LLVASAFFGIAVTASPGVQAATFVIINNDGAGEGFNDPTAAAPVGGNTGTTIGAQRLIAFQRAADIWSARLTSPVTIRVRAQFDPLTCSATSAVLGSAGPLSTYRDFSGALVANTWYAVALANALHGSDLDTADDINATFNSTLGTTCPFPRGWYYGLDGNPGSQIDFVSVLLHELGHGLGFLSLVNLSTGAKALGFDDTYMRNLENHGANPPDYPSMTDAQRVAASTSTGNLHWVGTAVRAASGLLTAGKVGDHVRMFAPSPQQPGSSVSHWDTALTPDQVMEPSYTVALQNPILELPLFQDIGWTVVPPGSKDFNGDGKGDILWRNDNGSVGMWLMNGAQIALNTGVANVTVDWKIAGVGDFNGDGKSDILWRNDSGSVGLWLMNGAQILSNTGVGFVGTVWKVIGTCDFNGDGKSDILWRHTDGTVGIWFMNGAQLVTSSGVANVTNDWKVAGVGDFNGDGRCDVLWRNDNGSVGLWLMNGAQIVSNVGVGSVTNDWKIFGIGDFNADFKSDILWRNDNGAVGVWLMNGAQIVSNLGAGSVTVDWKIAGDADFNGDEKNDILWRNDNGAVGMWLMSGAQIVVNSGVGSVTTDWKIIDFSIAR
jgi:hypothetical protein